MKSTRGITLFTGVKLLQLKRSIKQLKHQRRVRNWHPIRTSKISLYPDTPNYQCWYHLPDPPYDSVNYPKITAFNSFLTFCGTVQLTPKIDKNMFHRFEAIEVCKNKWLIVSKLCWHMKHLFASWNFLLQRLSWVRIASLMVVHVKHMILLGSLVLQIRFQGQHSVISFRTHKFTVTCLDQVSLTWITTS